MQTPKMLKIYHIESEANDLSRTAEAIARAEFGRFYWNEKLDGQLRDQNFRAGQRILEVRQEWKASVRAKAKTATKEFRRRIKAAQGARDKQTTGA